jgi:hypothetical protein
VHRGATGLGGTAAELGDDAGEHQLSLGGRGARHDTLLGDNAGEHELSLQGGLGWQGRDTPPVFTQSR